MKFLVAMMLFVSSAAFADTMNLQVGKQVVVYEGVTIAAERNDGAESIQFGAWNSSVYASPSSVVDQPRNANVSVNGLQYTSCVVLGDRTKAQNPRYWFVDCLP